MTKYTALLLSSVAVVTAWAGPSHAQRQTAVGPGIIPLDATGVLGGVDMSVSGATGTLSVGVAGGPRMDIYTLNNPVVSGLVAVSTGASSQGNIVFNSGSTVYGAIGVTQPGGPFLLNITGGAAGGDVNFNGPVFATTLNVSGSGAVNFNSGSTNITATNFAADGIVSLAPNTTLIGALTTTVGANTGTLSLGSAGVLDGAVGGAVGLKNISVVGGTDTTGVAATITGAANAYEFSLGTNTLNIGGALTIANLGPSGVINTTLASPTVYGNIRPVGATNLGPTLLLNVTVPATALIPVGSLFNIVQTQAGTVQSGTDGSVLTVTVKDPTNPLYTFEPVPLAGTLAGLVTIRTTAIPILVPVLPPDPEVVLPPTVVIAEVVTPVIIAVSPIIDPIDTPEVATVVTTTGTTVITKTIVPPGTPTVTVVTTPTGVTTVTTTAIATTDFLSVITPINAISDPVTVVNAVAQLAPSSADTAAPLVTYQKTREFQNLWLSRLEDALCSRFNRRPAEEEQDPTCRGGNDQGSWWIKGFGYLGTQNTQADLVGYDFRTIGTMLGYDAPVGVGTRAGFGVGYADSKIEDKSFNSSVDFDTYQATAYVGHQDGPWYVYGDMSFGWNEYSSKRTISFPGVERLAKSSYSGQDYTAFATTGYHIAAGDYTITPLASLQYSHVRLAGHTETGAGDVSLRVGGQNYNFLQSGLGVKAARDFAYEGGVITPEVHFKWLHDLGSSSIRQNAAFTLTDSPSFTTPNIQPNRDTFNLGAGINILSCACSSKKWSVDAVYDYEWRTDDYHAHRGVVRFIHRL